MFGSTDPFLVYADDPVAFLLLIAYVDFLIEE